MTDMPHSFPGVPGFLRAIGRFGLWLTGWRVEGSLPADRKAVIIAAPHTSGWDYVYMMLISWSIDLQIAWFGKHTLFSSPLGWFFRWTGGVPIDRRHPHGMVGSLADRFAASESLALAVPAEGTRAFRDHWKSGFYRIAEAAQVPIVMGFLDFKRKVGGFGPALLPTGDITADMDRIRAFYTPISGKAPELFCTIRLRSEIPSDTEQ